MLHAIWAAIVGLSFFAGCFLAIMLMLIAWRAFTDWADQSPQRQAVAAHIMNGLLVVAVVAISYVVGSYLTGAQ